MNGNGRWMFGCDCVDMISQRLDERGKAEVSELGPVNVFWEARNHAEFESSRQCARVLLLWWVLSRLCSLSLRDDGDRRGYATTASIANSNGEV